MPQPAPIPFPAFRASAEGPPDPALRGHHTARAVPAMPARPVKGVTRLPLTVPGAQPGAPIDAE
jgi:hypothetical protein